MANTLTNLLQVWLAKGYMALRNTYALADLVSRDFDNKPMEKGDRVRVPLPPVKTAATVTPAMTPPTPGDTSLDKVEILLDQWKYTAFAITDQELTQIEAGDYYNPANVEACMVGLIDGIVDSIWDKIHGANGFYSYVGTAGTNPFASNADALIDAGKILTDNKAPRRDRYAIFNTTATAAAQKLAIFQDADKKGDTSVKRDGFLGRVFGFDTYEDQQVDSHTAGTGASYQSNGAHSAGATTMAVDTGSGTVLPGDIFTVAGVSGTYRVVSSVGGGTVTSITFYPGLAAGIADNTAITLKATYRTNVAFHKGAIQLVTRPLAAPVSKLAQELGGSNLLAQAQMKDPETNISIRASVYRGWGMTGVYFDALWGAEVVRPDLGVIIAG